jgi:hypothetical protein
MCERQQNYRWVVGTSHIMCTKVHGLHWEAIRFSNFRYIFPYVAVMTRILSLVIPEADISFAD